MLPKLLGYNIPVVIFKKEAGRIKIKKDYGKLKVLPNGAEEFYIYKERVKMPSPPPEALIDGRVFVYRFAPSQYTYILFKLDDKRLHTDLFISNELKAVVSSEIKDLVRRYQEKGFWQTYGNYIVPMVIFVGSAILVYVMLKYGVIDVVKALKEVHVVCQAPVQTGAGAGAKPPV